jgi:uncharacterized integral membrane protein
MPSESLPHDPTPPFDAPVNATGAPPGAPPATTKTKPESAVHRTRAAALWSSLALGFLVLIILLIFIAQNTESAQFAFLGWRWSLPLGVALLAAAVAGGLLTVAVGAVRIFQLRRAAKKNLKAGL